MFQKCLRGAETSIFNSALKNPLHKRIGAPLRSARNLNIEPTDLRHAIVLLYSQLLAKNGRFSLLHQPWQSGRDRFSIPKRPGKQDLEHRLRQRRYGLKALA